MNQTTSADRTIQPAQVLHIVDVTVWVLLWSESQNALHIETVQDMQRSNIEAFNDNRRMDYVPLYIGSREHVDFAANAVRPICHARAEVRASNRERV